MEKRKTKSLSNPRSVRISSLLFNFQGLSLKEIWGYSSAGRAPALQAGGQRFDPAYLHQRPVDTVLDLKPLATYGPIAQQVRASA